MFTTLNPRLERSGARAVALTFVAAALFGCGGGGGGKHRSVRTGRLDFSVVWRKQPSRVIPMNAQSILVQVKQGGVVVDSGIVAAPATTVSFPELPTGAVSINASAYASLDGTGTALAAGTSAATIVMNQITNVSVNLASTIDHLEVTPNPFNVDLGLNGTIGVVGRDADGNLVLIDPSTITFSSSDPSVASVSSTGVITAGMSPGVATITVTEADSGKTLTFPVTVGPTVSVSPSSASLTLRQTQQFTGAAVGASSAVTWSIQEGAAGGTITAGGLYRAPAAKGTYHVVATSVVDPSHKAIIPIVISSGGASVVVH